ncbi:hypothetical protein KL86DES1_10482 [uncultured Desulfovibrio sp.]|uniref:Uncharacterized protein n=1 Tax=uncultured Desulfovibrio sp. TaxID=167968 RepID=A0A212KZ22_9BACT|nr:hypothetical protein KL86DES1_10482 [uncultured Desulfovibrio sp.]VZH32356.1 conserved protein of unknown function [Desulfovibrio sp. 86]
MDSSTMPDRRMGCEDASLGMLDPVMFFSAFGIVKAIQRTHKIAGDTAGTFKGHALAHQFLRGLHFVKQTRFHQHRLSPCT